MTKKVVFKKRSQMSVCSQASWTMKESKTLAAGEEKKDTQLRFKKTKKRDVDDKPKLGREGKQKDEKVRDGGREGG